MNKSPDQKTKPRIASAKRRVKPLGYGSRRLVLAERFPSGPSTRPEA